MALLADKPGRLICALLSGSWLAAGCNAPCDPAALDAATDAAGVEAACSIPEDLGATWSCATAVPEGGDVEALRALHEDCGLEALGSQERFATGNGDPARAALVHAWMVQNEVGGADEAGQLLVGEDFVCL